MTSRLPTVFLPHGGGPWTIVDLGPMTSELDPLRVYLEGLTKELPEAPKAVLSVSAHWEAPKATVMTAATPPMLYDYYGFPPASYEYVWPAKGAPEVAEKVVDHLQSAGIEYARDAERGFDHGTFVPMMMPDPRGEIPTFQLSLVQGLDPKTHIDIGRALAPLRDEGVLIVGSGMSYHNMRAFGAAMRSANARGPMQADALRFDDWLAELTTRSESEIEQRLIEWERAPAGRAAHPREEHLLPLMVVAGAGLGDTVSRPFEGSMLGAKISTTAFG